MSSQAPLSELTAFQRDVLVMVAANEGANGSELCRQLTDAYGEEITNPRFYPATNGLIDRGLVEKRKSDGPVNSYWLTETGWDAATADSDWRVKLLKTGERLFSDGQ